MHCGTKGCPTPATCGKKGCQMSGKDSATKPMMNYMKAMSVVRGSKKKVIPIKKA